MKITKGLSVRVDYELKVKGGDVLESSEKNGPLTYTHGGGRMLPALESRLEGLGVGEEKRGEIPGAEAFGTESAMPTRAIARKEFPADAAMTPGTRFEAKADDGQPIVLDVIDATDEHVNVRLIHPLAGKDLEYRVRVLAIEDAATGKRVHLPPPAPPAAALGIAADELKE
jgi:FKBP-type peptidyl-prolyl cis-trans isomerase 2